MTDEPRTSLVVRSAGAGDAAAIAAVLGRAFYDDPLWSWLVPDDATRVRRLTGLFEVMLRRVHLPTGGTESVGRGARTEAAALWAPPDRWRVPVRVQVAQAVPLIRAFGLRTPASLRTLGEVEKHHPREPHWYLAVIGTDPPAQGDGLGTALLRSRLDRCDAEGIPAYLESSKERNVPYYERFGFRVTRELALSGKGAPPIWLMWRDPGQGG
ncbi:acetyltransferase (GNAT) family protein [Actinomadura pelletieri DSM 43383]|uniref:Acetyltransferase (GNAT) family protein n=1 Tax=Actinomadura pelletieri DSM 43383 TaxID=1120940 RepID=A0A495QMH1_9ACTN|nr:GNAT family N-acetyltransferase [Actinomadura pelletieri]RKS73708.1 acetyltransferase (GNAT) family protein [Actinomadura pelletieri DSM 43383]